MLGVGKTGRPLDIHLPAESAQALDKDGAGARRLAEAMAAETPSVPPPTTTTS